MTEPLLNIIRREIERFHSDRFKPNRIGLVTSYDKKTYSVKVMFQPEGTESGWIPIKVHHAGNGYGVLYGPTPGDGKATGDQVEVSYQEGEFDTGRVIARVHSDQDKPPQVESGEMLLQHSSGAYIKIDKNNLITINGAGGETITLDKGGTITAKGKGGNQMVLGSDGSALLQDKNSGTIYANGGKVYLGSKTAATAVMLSTNTPATKVFAV